MSFYDEVDYFTLAQPLDVMSFDFYPGTNWGEGKFGCGPQDYIRSLKHKPWWVMEQRSGLTGWTEMFNSGDQPGQLRLWSWQAVAHGADAVVYFRWRTSRFGIEQYWHGILDHHGQPGRRFREVARVAKEFSVVGEKTTGAEYTAPAGILISPESRWALDIQKGSPSFSYLAHANGYHRAFHEQHVGVEYYQPSDDFSKAKVLVAPSVFLCNAALAAKLTAYVEAGGTLITTLRTGVKDDANVVTTDRLPGALKALTGCIVEEYDAYINKESYPVESVAPLPKKPGQATVWADQLKLTTAKPLARYAAGPFKGSPAASIHTVGKGTVIYVGFVGDEAFNRNLIRWVLGRLDLVSPFPPSNEIEITERVKGANRYLFVLNHAGAPQKLPLKGRTGYRDLITGKKTGRVLTLPPYDVRILAPIQTA
jgi:beta-galactosidase